MSTFMVHGRDFNPTWEKIVPYIYRPCVCPYPASFLNKDEKVEMRKQADKWRDEAIKAVEAFIRSKFHQGWFKRLDEKMKPAIKAFLDAPYFRYLHPGKPGIEEWIEENIQGVYEVAKKCGLKDRAPIEMTKKVGVEAGK